MKIKIQNSTKHVLNMLLSLSGLVTLVTSYIVWFILPHGIGMHGGFNYCSGSGAGKTGNNQYILGWTRPTWISIHNWSSVVLFIIIVIHVIIHWNWIVETSKRISENLKKLTGKVSEVYGTVMILLALHAFESGSGLILWLVIPRGKSDYGNMVSGTGRTFLGLQRNIWVDLHAWVAVLIVSIIIVHLVLNWKWVLSFTKKIVSGALRSKI